MLGCLLLAPAAAGPTASAPANGAAPARTGEAITWSQAFGALSDTVAFLAVNGAVWRGPFSLAARETLWTPQGDERLARLRVSPDGAHLAFLSRAADEDTTRLWTWNGGVPVVRTRFFSLVPSRYDRLLFEPATPTVEDPRVHGARFVEPSLRGRGRSSNTLEWTADGSRVLFAYNDGIASLPADSGAAAQVSAALAARLVPLAPTPIVLAEAVVMREGIQHEAWMLLYPAGTARWRAFPASGLDERRPWVAGEETVWWVAGDPGKPGAGTIEAVRSFDPKPATAVNSHDAVTAITYDAAHRALVWAAGRAVLRHPESGGGDAQRLATGTPIKRALSGNRGSVAFVTTDSLIVWDPARDSTRAAGLGELSPTGLFEAPNGDVLVAGGGTHGGPPVLTRADFEHGRLEAVTTPAIKNPAWVATPGAEFLLLWSLGTQSPAAFDVYDTGARAWKRVINPGIVGWETAAPTR